MSIMWGKKGKNGEPDEREETDIPVGIYNIYIFIIWYDMI